MTTNELKCILDAVRHAEQTMLNLGSDNYPYTDFKDKEINEYFICLLNMEIALSKKIKALEVKEA